MQIGQDVLIVAEIDWAELGPSQYRRRLYSDLLHTSLIVVSEKMTMISAAAVHVSLVLESH